MTASVPEPVSSAPRGRRHACDQEAGPARWAKRRWLLVGLGMLLFVAVALFMNLGPTTIWAAYPRADAAPGAWPADWPVAFYQRSGWPFEAYEFADLSAVAADPRIQPVRLVAISGRQYSELYDRKFSTGMSTALEKWKLKGIAFNLWLEAAAFGLVALGVWGLVRLRRKAGVARRPGGAE